MKYPIFNEESKFLTPRMQTAIATIALLLAPICMAFDTPTAISNITIEDPLSGTIENATIVIDDGRIVAAGADVQVPAHAEIIDGKGAIAYPCFIDGQSFLGMPKTARTESQRIRTEDENPDVRIRALTATRQANRKGIRPQLRAIEEYEAKSNIGKPHRDAGFGYTLITPRDGIFSGTSDLIDLSGRPIRQIITAEEIAMHASFRTGEDGGYPRSLLGVMAQFRQVILDTAHQSRLEKYLARHPQSANPAPIDPALRALQPILAGQQLLFFEANSEREIRRALSFADEFGLRIGITGARQAWKLVEELKRRNVPLIVSLDFGEKPKRHRLSNQKSESAKEKSKEDKDTDKNEKDEPGKKKKESGEFIEPLRQFEERIRIWEDEVRNLKVLSDADVQFALRTRDFAKMSDFKKHLRLAIEQGFDEASALKALTTSPATLFGIENHTGSIAPGYAASFALFDKPFHEKKAKVSQIFVNGKRFQSSDAKGGKRKETKEEEHEDQCCGRPHIDEFQHEPRHGLLAMVTVKTELSPPEDEEEETDEEDEVRTASGPDFEVELDADRVPTTRTNGTLLITNATIIPVTSPTIENGDILVRHGKITAVSQSIDTAPGVREIDGTGLFVMPGIVDPHSHLGLDAVNEGPLAISAEVRIADVINPTSVGIYRAVAGGATTHHVMHGSANPIGGQNATIKLKYGDSAKDMFIRKAPRTIKFATGENVTQANRDSARGKRYPNTRMGVEDVYRQALLAARQYMDELTDYHRETSAGLDSRPVRRDLRLEALAEVLRGEMAIHAHCYRSDEIIRLLGVAEEFGLRIGTLHHVLEGYRIAPEIARHGCGASTFSNFWAYKIEAYGAIPHNAALMTEHGICASVNSDSGNTIRYLGQEAAKSIRWGGLNETEALKLITLNPAIQLQIDDRVGSIEVGKDADFAIFNGHPLNTFSRCVMTIIDGEVYFEDKDKTAYEPCDKLHMPGDVDFEIPSTVHKAYAITGATIHPISSPPIENATVITVDDKIHAVGTNVDIPPGAGIIDGSGMHVYPGLIDAGNTLGLVEIGSVRSTRDNRDIPQFSPHLVTASAIHPHSEHIRITRVAGTTTALSKPSGSRIAGQSAIIHLDGWTVHEMLVNDAFALHMTVPSLSMRFSSDKSRMKRQEEELKKSTQEIEKYMDQARHYAKVVALSEEDPDIKFDRSLHLEAMIPYVSGEKPIIFSANSYKQILDTLAFAEKQNVKCIITGGREAWKLADKLAEKNIPVILGTPLSYPSGKFEPWDSVYRCASRLHEAGVKFCFASESYEHAYDLGTMAGMAVAFGLPREAAEHALTLGAAEILGMGATRGSLEAGKQADLIVTTASPLQTSSVVTHMFIDGEPIELTSMHTESYEKFKNRPMPHLPPDPILVGPGSMTDR